MAEPDLITRQNDRNLAIQWARRMFMRERWAILDTETTGIDSKAEIIQIGVLDGASGKPLMDNVLVRPNAGFVPQQASDINHITTEMVAKSPDFFKVWPQLKNILSNAGMIVIYNAAYDTRLIQQTANLYRLQVPPYPVNCAMLNFASFKGEWNQTKQGYKWPKLQGGDHSALGDCRATLKLMEMMADADLAGITSMFVETLQEQP